MCNILSAWLKQLFLTNFWLFFCIWLPGFHIKWQWNHWCGPVFGSVYLRFLVNRLLSSRLDYSPSSSPRSLVNWLSQMIRHMAFPTRYFDVLTTKCSQPVSFEPTQQCIPPLYTFLEKYYLSVEHIEPPGKIQKKVLLEEKNRYNLKIVT